MTGGFPDWSAVEVMVDMVRRAGNSGLEVWSCKYFRHCGALGRSRSEEWRFVEGAEVVMKVS